MVTMPEKGQSNTVCPELQTSKNNILLPALFILALCVGAALFGCTSKNKAPLPKTINDLTIEVTTDKETYKIGEKVKITAKIKNVGTSAVKYPPLDAWTPTKPDRLDALQFRYFGPGFFRGSPLVDGYEHEGYEYARGERESFLSEPETLNPGEERSVTFEKGAISAGSFKIEANFCITNKSFLRIVKPPDAVDSRDFFAAPRERIEIPDGWTGLIRATKAVTIQETVVDETVAYLQRRASDLKHDSSHTRHGAMKAFAEHYPYSGRSYLLAGLDDTQVIRSKQDRVALVRALADSLRRCFAWDVLEKLFEISMDNNEELEVRLEALEAYYLLTPKYLVKEGFILQPEQDMVNQFTANIGQLKQSEEEQIKKKAEEIEEWSKDNTKIDP